MWTTTPLGDLLEIDRELKRLLMNHDPEKPAFARAAGARRGTEAAGGIKNQLHKIGDHIMYRAHQSIRQLPRKTELPATPIERLLLPNAPFAIPHAHEYVGIRFPPPLAAAIANLIGGIKEILGFPGDGMFTVVVRKN